MLEFAREQYLWLFALVALFFVVFFFARRWKKARVTYGFIWERVAKRTRPPTWKRLLRLILTLLISAAMLSSAALYAAGLGPAKEEQPAPLLIFIAIDNSPSMRARVKLAEENTRIDAALARAMNWAVAPGQGEHGRTMEIQFSRGKPIGGRWENWRGRANQRGTSGEMSPTDFARPDMASLAEFLSSVGVPPDVPALPKPQPLLVWIGDEPPALPKAAPPARLAQLAPADRWHTFAGMPAIFETFGSRIENEAVVEANYKPAPAGSDFAGTLEGKLRTGGAAYVEITSGSRDEGIALFKLGTPYNVPLTGKRRLVLAGKQGWEGNKDAFAWDDLVEVPQQSPALTTIAIVRPKGDEANTELRQGIELLIPGRQVSEVQAGEAFKADIVVLDRVSVETDCKLLLCFGALPPSLGDVQPAREAKAGLFDALEKPDWLGFEIPNLQLLAGREAFPLKPGHKLTPLATHVEAGVLIAASRGERDVLYIGYSPTQSNFLFTPEGPTLLQRWLNAAMGRERMIVPPFCRMDQSVEIKLDSPAALRVKLIKGWENVIGATEYEVTPSPDSRARLGPFEQPGEYSVTQNGRELGRMSVYWVNEAEQALPFTPLPPLDLTKLAPARENSWVDWFPEVLLWIALFGLLLEYLFWLAGITD